jgi:hypothetical protein
MRRSANDRFLILSGSPEESAIEPVSVLASALRPGENLEWSDRPGPIAPSRDERRFAVAISLLVAGIAVILAAVEGAEALVLGAIFAAALLAPFSTLSYIGWQVGRRPRACGITDRPLSTTPLDASA